MAKHRTKREVLRIVRSIAPAPSVPDRIEPLGPDHVGIPLPRVPSWRTLLDSLGSSVRELPPGDRPKDWVDPAPVSFTASQAYVDQLEQAQALLSHAVPQRSLEEVHLRALLPSKARSVRTLRASAAERGSAGAALRGRGVRCATATRPGARSWTSEDSDVA